MASRVKEDARNEKTIRNLLKLPENRRCINCNSLGPQYVCTNFWTFVCTNCSGIHREFTHRVKSISISKFTSQEVAALQGGGNARAKEVYLKELDTQRNSFPYSSNVERLRDFIKHVYVDRRYTGERSFDKPPRGKMGEPEDSYANKRNDAYQSGSRSPASEDGYDRRYGERPSPGGRSDDRNSLDSRSPGYQESRQYGDNRRSPAHAEVVNDWRREDRFGNGRKTEDSRTSDTRSPDLQRDGSISSPPMVRPVREILGDNVLPLRIDPPKDNGSFHTQRSVSSSSLASSNGNPPETKNENFGSLIDFDAFAEPIPVTATPQQPQQAVPDKSTEQVGTLSNDDNWASFDSAPSTISSASSSANSLLSVFSQFSSATTSIVAPPSAVAPSSNLIPGGDLFELQSSYNPPVAPPGQMFGSNIGSNFQSISPANNPPVAPPGQMFGSNIGSNVQSISPANNFAQFPSSTGPVAVSGPTSGFPSNAQISHVNVAVAGQLPGMPHGQHSSFPASQSLAPSVGGPPTNQPWNSTIAPTAVASSNVAPVPTGKSGLLPASEPQSSSRKELPQDIFTSTYPSYGAMPGWQTAPLPGFGFHMQYNSPAMQMPHLHSSKSSNPFDLNDEMPPPVQFSAFTSMGSMQGALPNVAAPGGGAPLPPTWGPQSSYASGVPQQAQPFMSTMPPSASMTQSVPNNTPISGVMDFFGPSSSSNRVHHQQPQHQEMGGIYSAPAAAGNPFPAMGGNPFG